jgi:Kae1-associated kinase Bud32
MGSIKEGAEAQIFKTSFLGLEAVDKLRVSKDYREKSLDCKILLERLRTECSLIHKAKKAGVRTPLIFDINKKKLSITMEFIKGKTMKEILEKNPESAERLCKEAGKIISKLHCFGIIHGDLTTSNFICSSNGLVLSDFGLGYFSKKTEDMATDLLCFKKSFMSTHYYLAEKWVLVEKEYEKFFPTSKDVFNRIKSIEARARYY